MHELRFITELSHEFGTADYVLGGGGNTSVKTSDTLWIKPSGVTLCDLRPEDFVALDRARLAESLRFDPPADVQQREAMVKDRVLASRLPGQTGRPSVEAPLHNLFPQRFVVHTHPALVNGLTCSREGAQAAARLFPDALWLSYCDPGFVLSREAGRAIASRMAGCGAAPAVLLLENHGVFVAGDTPQEIRRTYAHIFDALHRAYRAAGVAEDLPPTPPPSAVEDAAMRQLLRQGLPPAECAHIVSAGPFPPPRGPLSPDHIVYARSYVHIGWPDPDSIAAFRAQYGFSPRVFCTESGVWACGATEKEATLALIFARDGARVQALAEAFGGPQYLSDAARRFIEEWEVEQYRRTVAVGTP